MKVSSTFRAAALTIAIATSMTLSACSSNDDGNKDKDAGSGPSAYKTASMDPDDVCEAGREGGALHYRASPEGAGLDPVVSQANQNAGGAIYGTLMTWDSQASQFVGDLADSMTANDDATEWTLKLRDDVQYPDGSHLDAEAVKANMERYVDPAFPSAYTSRVAEIKTMTVKDDSTLVFTLASAWGTFPWLLTQNPGMIVNPAVLANTDAADLAAAPPEAAGAGAFTLKTYDRGQSVTLRGKTDWWGGTVCLDELKISFGANDASADYEALEAGQVDGILAYDPQPLNRAIEKGSYDIYRMPGAIGSPILMNSAKAPFDDVRMRKALNLSMDRELINQRIFQDLALPAGGIVPPDLGYELAVKPLDHDESEASSLVKAAADDGVNTTFEYTVNRSPINENMAILQQALAGKAGMTIDLDLIQQPDWIEKVFGTRNFESAMGGITVDASCPYCGLDQFTSTSATNVSSFKSAAVDEALANLKAATPDELPAAIDAVQKVWNDEVPVVIASWLQEMAVVDPKVHGLSTSTSTFMLKFDKAYIAD